MTENRELETETPFMKTHSSVPLKSQTQQIDKLLLFTTLFLVIFGLIMILNVSIVEATRAFGDKFFFVRKQALWAVVGIAGMFLLSKTPYRIFEKFGIVIFIGAVFLLIGVLVPGVGTSVLGARRWIEIGPLVVQPSEFAKLALVIYLSLLLSKQRPLLSFLLPVGLVTGLVMLQPDLGTAVIIGTVALALYFASGASLVYFLMLVPVVSAAGLLLILTSPYRKARLLTFLNPNSDPLGASYHIRQVLIALGSGGLFGLGLGQSRQKYLFLPEPTTDSIFAIIAEELGFAGSALILGLLLFFVWRGFLIAMNTSDSFGRLLALGITSWIGVQAFVNLAAMVAVVPLTGVPLPFLSYGGSSLITVLLGVGILLNISRSRERRSR